mmetsp:Transcript_24576/g.38932  ORF Transcript_24576/g.38932 Transcript_24576/m.38932 type:complete len:114 (+) Transcript_24576:1001-1342(+)
MYPSLSITPLPIAIPSLIPVVVSTSIATSAPIPIPTSINRAILIPCISKDVPVFVRKHVTPVGIPIQCYLHFYLHSCPYASLHLHAQQKGNSNDNSNDNNNNTTTTTTMSIHN